MPFKARMVLDSISNEGVRVCTMEMTYPLIVHNEDLRHRTHWKTDSMKFEQWLDAGRSVMSNRAVAPAKLRNYVVNDPYIPVFVAATAGMVGGAELIDQSEPRTAWLWARDQAVKAFDRFESMPGRVHKQHRNRLLMPFQFVTVVTTANAQWWEHWFDLRHHPAAQPDIQVVAALAHKEYALSTPQRLFRGDWHLPYVSFDEVMDYDLITARRVSAARCARSSYMRQGEVLALRDDLRLYEDLDSSVPPHDSPREHVLTPIGRDERAGHMVGWASMRHFMEGVQ
jgi:hypothetical protein